MADASRAPPMGLRHINLKKSFRLNILPLLTAISKEDFNKAFSSFTNAEREYLYRIFLEVRKSLHKQIEVEFESICDETKIGTVLDSIEQLVEEQNLDILSTDKTNIKEVKEMILKAKKDEINRLTSLIRMTEEHNTAMKAHIESLKEIQARSDTADMFSKLKSWASDY